MGKFIAIGLFLVIGAGAVFLLTWDIPAPERQIEKTLDDDRFPS